MAMSFLCGSCSVTVMMDWEPVDLTFKGPLGQLCSGDVHLHWIVQFTSMTTSVPDLEEPIWKDLSQDQQLLYRWTKAITASQVPANLAGQLAGPTYHSRWWLMQFYATNANPSNKLVLVVKYVVQVYSPVWFLIKRNSKFTHHPSVVFTLLRLINS